MEFPNPKTLPGFQGWDERKIKQDVPLFATKYKPSQVVGSKGSLFRDLSLIFSWGFLVSKRNLIWSAPYWYLNKLWQHFKFYVNTKYVAGVYHPIIFNLFVFLKKILGPKVWKTIETQILFKNFNYLGFLFSFYWRNYIHVLKSQMASYKVWKDGSYSPLASISSSPKAVPLVSLSWLLCLLLCL